jgi:hypothetical protein
LLLARGLAGGADDPRGSASNCVDVGCVSADRPQLVREEQVEVAHHPCAHLLALRRRLHLRHLLAVLRPAAVFDDGSELAHRGEGALGPVGLDDVGVRVAPALGIGKKLHERRLMRDEPAHELGVTRDQLQADRAAAARAEDVRRLVTDRPEERSGVVGVNRRRKVLRLPVEGTARVASLVVADDRVPVGQPSGEVGEHARVGRPAGDQKQHRA